MAEPYRGTPRAEEAADSLPLLPPPWLAGASTSPAASRNERPGLSGPGGIVLCGATGFLGVHLLSELLGTEGARLTCLVRGTDDAAASERLWKRVGWYFPELERSRLGQHIQVLAADLTRERLGLSERTYRALAETHSAVFNAAADVRHVGHREEFQRINTDGVQRLLEFSRQGQPKHLHHVSTVAVKGRLPEGSLCEAFTERHLDVGQRFPDHPYAESKYEAEVLLRAAFEQGTAGTIYRVGNIGPHSVSGRFQTNIGDSAFAAHVWCCARLGFAPYRPQAKLRLMPVDVMANAVHRLASSSGAVGKTYHLEHWEELSHYDVMRVLQAFGYAIRLASERDFVETAPSLTDDDATLATLLQTGASEDGAVTRVDSAATVRELRQLGFECAPASARWLMQFFEHAIEVGFLDPPRFRRRLAWPDLQIH
jgi:thioester reductase-like protein